MKKFYEFVILFLLLLGFPLCGYCASIDWDKAFVVYEGQFGEMQRYTMGSPFLNMLARRNGTSLEIWAQPEANLVAANTFILLSNISIGYEISPDFIYSSSDYFAYAVYADSGEGYEERADYSMVISQGESVYLGFASQPGTMTDPITCGWVELGLDDEGVLTVIHSAWDRDGDPIAVGATPEPLSGLLLLVGGALLALRRRKNLV